MIGQYGQYDEKACEAGQVLKALASLKYKIDAPLYAY